MKEKTGMPPIAASIASRRSSRSDIGAPLIFNAEGSASAARICGVAAQGLPRLYTRQPGQGYIQVFGSELHG